MFVISDWDNIWVHVMFTDVYVYVRVLVCIDVIFGII